ncbi:hypothetical protein [Streptomyces nodosus]|uniref:hypothetical protein n=1 Tax=Streptomyces nodosus TaxID=40318 RepID=UPI0038136AAB
MLDGLAHADDEHPDVSLTHERGWCLSAFCDGIEGGLSRFVEHDQGHGRVDAVLAEPGQLELLPHAQPQTDATDFLTDEICRRARVAPIPGMKARATIAPRFSGLRNTLPIFGQGRNL